MNAEIYFVVFDFLGHIKKKKKQREQMMGKGLDVGKMKKCKNRKNELNPRMRSHQQSHTFLREWHAKGVLSFEI